MIPRILLVFCFFCCPEGTAFADELAGGSGSDSVVDGYGQEVRRPEGCHPSVFEARALRHRECITNFSKYGITEVIKPHEIVDLSYCPPPQISSGIRVNPNAFAAHNRKEVADFLSGCAEGVLELGIEIAEGALSLITSYDPEAEAYMIENCGHKPRFQFENLQLRSGQRPEEQETREKWLGRVSSWEKCRNTQANKFEEEQASKKRTQAKIAEEQEIKEKKISYEITKMRFVCHKELRISSRAAGALSPNRQRAVETCILRKAGEAECSDCVRRLAAKSSSTPFLDILHGLYMKMEGQVYPVLQCYNTRTNAKIFCKIAASVLGGGYGVAKVGAKVGPGIVNAVKETIRRNTIKRKRAGKPSPGSSDSAATAAARANATAYDSLETRRAFAENVLRDKGLLASDEFLSPEQAKAIWEAHSQFGDAGREIFDAGIHLKKVNLNRQQIRALMEEKVTGGFAGLAPVSVRIPSSSIVSALDFSSLKVVGQIFNRGLDGFGTETQKAIRFLKANYTKALHGAPLGDRLATRWYLQALVEEPRDLVRMASDYPNGKNLMLEVLRERLVNLGPDTRRRDLWDLRTSQQEHRLEIQAWHQERVRAAIKALEGS